MPRTACQRGRFSQPQLHRPHGQQRGPRAVASGLAVDGHLEFTIGKIPNLEPIPHQISIAFWSMIGILMSDEDMLMRITVNWCSSCSRTRSTINSCLLPGCTLENPSSAQLCDACGASRPTAESAKARVFFKLGNVAAFLDGKKT